MPLHPLMYPTWAGRASNRDPRAGDLTARVLARLTDEVLETHLGNVEICSAVRTFAVSQFVLHQQT